MAAPDGLYGLVERFERNKDAYRSGSYNETQVRVDFINPLFELLGWDVTNREGHPPAYQDVAHEDAIKVGGAHKAPDYGFRIGGQRKFFVEAKKPSVNLQESADPAFQLRRYAWSAKLPISILTDFEEFAVYDCRVTPDKNDRPTTARLNFYTSDTYVDVWDELVGTFSKEAVRHGSLDAFADTAKTRRGTVTVDAVFLQEIESWRERLACDLAVHKPDLTCRELNHAVQMTIDRIIFLRMAEDRGIEEYGRLKALLDKHDVYASLKDLYRQADDRYNSGLFHFQTERGRPEQPDDLTPHLTISDATLQGIIKHLYYPDSPYEFSVLPIEVLGQVYEQFLGKVIDLSPDRSVVIEEKPEVRKAGGVYYTPKYIVDYIVAQTIGKLLDGKKPGPRSTVNRLRVVDPACGSGSFLIGAFEYLLDWHRDQYVDDGPEKHRRVLYRGAGGQWMLTTDEKKRILLNNIYGVDIDPQAVEVTKLSLLLKVLEGESSETLVRQLAMFHERVLPDLGNNIKCGNSLIGPDFYDNRQIGLFDDEEHFRINVFDWRESFPSVFAETHPGFDVVIGNPPYIFTREQITEAERKYYSTHYEGTWEKHNTFMLFMELLLGILRTGGKGSFIVPNSWLTIESAKLLRGMYVPKVQQIVDLNYPVFDRVSMEPTIFVIAGADQTASVRVSRGESKEVLEDGPGLEVDKKEWTGPDWRIVFSTSAESSRVLTRLLSNAVTVSDRFDVRTGLQAYEKGKGDPPQTADDVKNHVFDRQQWEDENSYRYLMGADVGRYEINWSGTWMQYGRWLSQPRELGIFARPRVLVREIT